MSASTEAGRRRLARQTRGRLSRVSARARAVAGSRSCRAAAASPAGLGQGVRQRTAQPADQDVVAQLLGAATARVPRGRRPVVHHDVGPVADRPAQRGQVVGQQFLLAADAEQPRVAARGQVGVPAGDRGAAEETEYARSGQRAAASAGWSASTALSGSGSSSSPTRVVPASRPSRGCVLEHAPRPGSARPVPTRSRRRSAPRTGSGPGGRRSCGRAPLVAAQAGPAPPAGTSPARRPRCRRSEPLSTTTIGGRSGSAVRYSRVWHSPGRRLRVATTTVTCPVSMGWTPTRVAVDKHRLLRPAPGSGPTS